MDIGACYRRWLRNNGTKSEALYRALREYVQAGHIRHGEALPSTRELAHSIDVSRGTVLSAVDRLISEGFVEGKRGSGIYVSYQPFNLASASERQAEQALPSSVPPHVSLSNWAAMMMSPNMRYSTTDLLKHEYAEHESRLISTARVEAREFTSESRQTPISLNYHLLNESLFSQRVWQQCLYAAVRDMNWGRGMDTQGDSDLREAIAVYLARQRGIRASKEQIVIFQGSKQALMLLCRCLVNEGDTVITESPSYIGISQAIRAAGGCVEAAAIEDEGELERKLHGTHARLAILTPNRQFPTGRTLSLTSRQALLQWAANGPHLIIEDDYDSEFGWGGKMYEPLHVMDERNSIVYVGSFSRTLTPSLRIGYAVLPEWLVEPVVSLKQLTEPYAGGQIEQRALADFMLRGEYEKHIRRAKRFYSKKVQTFCRLMQEKVGHLFNWYAGDIGLHLFARWRQAPELFPVFKDRANHYGVKWADVDKHDILRPVAPGAMFGFAHLEESDWHEACRRMLAAWADIQPK
ncbi:aminotransferase-like domain-containing protein [Paenibacillus sp. 481]|uniref:aminotransferase-like domain-containing protein n=1 Tax=Paenibacillus sp. 481 TaxID=2835869 RepID=UPI001E618F18|nr:PLP-dependent aminotransferase family protein [Paenibacillus sp. 481]UHA74532.1 PLP-dependent aminotransferase family protein [Paenibacillus sp. 481]